VEPDRISHSVLAKGPGPAMPINLMDRHGHSHRLRVGVVLMADPERHPTFSRTSDSSGHALPPCLDLFVSHVVDVLSVVLLDVTQPSMNAIELCRPTFVENRLPALTIVLTATTTTHASTPTRASSHRHPTANVAHRRETRVGIRARATGFRRSSARVKLN